MNSTPLRWLWAFGFGLWALGSLFSTPLLAADKTTAGELITEPPTLLSLGFEWRIEGDDNRNAQAAVSYRKAGEQTWKAGPPLLRIGNERINENALQYITPNGFAGSIFDLEPGTTGRDKLVRPWSFVLSPRRTLLPQSRWPPTSSSDNNSCLSTIRSSAAKRHCLSCSSRGRPESTTGQAKALLLKT